MTAAEMLAETAGAGRGPRVGIVGGGINGTGIAWELARKKYDVVLFERGTCGAQTSSASTKMIHGGIRYLEHLHFDLVRESLLERGWLLAHLPELVKPMEIVLPVYADSPRSRFMLKLGLTLYDTLAGRRNIAKHRSLTAAEVTRLVPVREEGLRGGFAYWDAQVDDFQLVQTVVSSARREGADVREHTEVSSVRKEDAHWIVTTAHGEERFDLLVNAAGPWMNEFLDTNDIDARYVLSLVRGSHIVLQHEVSNTGALLQSVTDRRVFFVLPWKGTTLVGTTEVMQKEPLDRVRASEEEIDYLVARFNHYFVRTIARGDIASSFAGVRPLVGRATNPSALDRDFRVTRRENLINVFGGKLTTFMALARRVGRRVDNYFGHARRAAEPVFVLR